jgi:hypothetical protein
MRKSGRVRKAAPIAAVGFLLKKTRKIVYAQKSGLPGRKSKNY